MRIHIAWGVFWKKDNPGFRDFEKGLGLKYFYGPEENGQKITHWLDLYYLFGAIHFWRWRRKNKKIFDKI